MIRVIEHAYWRSGLGESAGSSSHSSAEVAFSGPLAPTAIQANASTVLLLVAGVKLRGLDSFDLS
jgi:hypothetical protein